MLSASVAEYDIADVRTLVRGRHRLNPEHGPGRIDLSGRGPVRPNDDQTNEKETATMKLTTTTFVSVDGVMQGIGAPDEDRRGGFARGGWAVPYADQETMALLNQVYARADAFLFGRRTYEIFAGSWGTWEDPGDNPIWRR